MDVVSLDCSFYGVRKERMKGLLRGVQIYCFDFQQGFHHLNKGVNSIDMSK